MKLLPAAAGSLLLIAAELTGAQVGVFRREASGVRLDVLVTQSGRPVTGLRAEDFELLDNGVPQRLDAVATAGQISLCLLLDDTVRLVDRAHLDALARSARFAAAALHETERASFATYTNRVKLQARDVDRETLVRAIDRAVGAEPPVGNYRFPAMWDAIFFGAALAVEGRGRPVVLLLGDGADSRSWLVQNAEAGDTKAGRQQRAALFESMLNSGVIVDVVSPPAAFGRRSPLGGVNPEEAAAGAGGVRFRANDSDLAAKLSGRFDALRAGYVITYTPAGVNEGDGWHRLTIRLKNRRARIEARDRYFAGGSAEPKNPEP